MPHLGTAELLIILGIILLLFGAQKVPELARGLGHGLKEFKQAVKEVSSEEEDVAAGVRTGTAPKQRIG
jgi:sec-independent protein translocase protein TatA